tara:strand:- start:497 stop:637 length:141 start_codon:yes stop_codon:yes gene_type:complete
MKQKPDQNSKKSVPSNKVVNLSAHAMKDVWDNEEDAIWDYYLENEN